jgi:uncharacterized phage protein (predicted DNA packaging)
MALIDDVKEVLRISGTDTDTEITDLIDTAKADLLTSGVLDTKIVDTDALIKMAIKLFCKAHYGYDTPDADRFKTLYDEFKSKLCTLTDYIEVVE